MLRNMIMLIMSAIVSLPAFAADNATKILEQTATKIRTAPSVAVTFTISGSNGAESDRLTISGERFMLTSPSIAVWYDGTTQWTLVKADREVTIDEPTDRELAQINPFIIIKSFQQNFTAKTLSNNSSTTKIQLTAKSPRSDIKEATVTISKSTSLPSELSLKTASGQSIAIKITSITIGKAINAASFRFDHSRYPSTEINDLR